MTRIRFPAVRPPMPNCNHAAIAVGYLVLMGAVSGCSQDMYDQPRIEPLEASEFFADGLSARPQLAGTVARDQQYSLHPYYTGRRDGQFVTEIPAPPDGTREAVDLAFVRRGQQRFNIFCSHCHGATGYGDGMVIQRGFPKPPSLHEPRLREAVTDGQIFDTIRHGYRKMPAQGERIPAYDRWRIVAYVRVLQYSQHVPLDSLPQDLQRRFRELSP